MGALRIDRLTGPPGPLRDGTGRVIAARCYRTGGMASRLIGLLGTPDLADDEALWLEPCSSVHTIGLRAPIGCAFVDGAGRVLWVVDPMKRWRVSAIRGALAVVECRAGILEGLAVGDRLVPP